MSCLYVVKLDVMWVLANSARRKLRQEYGYEYELHSKYYDSQDYIYIKTLSQNKTKDKAF